MITCNLKGIYVGNSDFVGRNGSSTPCIDIYVHSLKKSFSVFRCSLKFTEGELVNVPCELRLRQDGSPYFVYLAPSEALQGEADNKLNSLNEKKN